MLKDLILRRAGKSTSLQLFGTATNPTAHVLYQKLIFLAYGSPGNTQAQSRALTRPGSRGHAESGDRNTA